MTAVQLRDEALLMLEGKGAILEVARQVTRVIDENKTTAAIIGGVAVVLHGHIRTTADVDVFISSSTDDFARQLRANGFAYSTSRREFSLSGVPVHLVTREQTTFEPKKLTRIEDVRTVSLADLINFKLDSGLRNLTRAQDIADVIGLIRANQLTAQFAAKITKSLRTEFRKLVKAVRKESQ